MGNAVAPDGASDSNLGTGVVAVAQGPFSLTSSATVRPSAPLNSLVPFWATVQLSNGTTPAAFEWNFGDGSDLTNVTNGVVSASPIGIGIN